MVSKVRELKVAIVGNLGITAVTENCLRCWSDGCGDATTQYSQVMGSGAGPFNVFATKVKFGLLLLFSASEIGLSGQRGPKPAEVYGFV
ncbi:hypothetical protein KSS87_017501, partial [Heliosperma pusillum]